MSEKSLDVATTGDGPVRNSAALDACACQNKECDAACVSVEVKKEKKVVRRVKAVTKRKIPDDIVLNEALNTAIAILPSNYNFEIHKTLWRIRTEKSSVVALQFPEGLLMYSCVIADILIKWGGVKVMILGDVTYGACCIDDFTAQKLGADLLVHYGHSCLVPVNVTKIKVVYVFIEIDFNERHLIDCMKNFFPKEARIALMGTIQFTSVLHRAVASLTAHFPHCNIPQAKPLSSGETLGCTSPVFKDTDALVFVADGRFHLEAAMIRNPDVKAYRYDPYGKTLTFEQYDVERMKAIRLEAINRARSGATFGLILGTLGRQGSPPIFRRIQKLLAARGKKVIPFLMAEINPDKLALIDNVDVWIQVACPRLSIDWSGGFGKDILTPYEIEVAMDETKWQDVYPMDFYASEGNNWSAGAVQNQRK
jgi:2-(3-amino-3-carboxypropyl)histidine synthase